jgi:hypothetical protein
LNAAALQFVRKISGFQKPSQANTEVFERAVAEVAAASQRLLDGLTVRPGRTRVESPEICSGLRNESPSD